MSKANPRYRRTNPLLPTPVNNVYRVRFVGSCEAQMTVNTFYYADELAIGTATQTTLANLYNGIVAAGNLRDLFLPCVTADWKFSYILVDCPTSPSLATYKGVASQVGTAAGAHEPLTVAVVISKITAVKGQCGRGHVSMPAVPTGVVTLSSISTLTAYNAFAAQMLTNITNGGHTFTPGVFSRGNRLTKQVGWAPLFTTLIQLVLGTVRRRKLGRGK